MRIFTVVGLTGLSSALSPRPCEEGFDILDSGQCQDVDECATGAHNCQAPFTCHNIPGSYGCDFGQPRSDLKCGLAGDFGTCSGLPWSETELLPFFTPPSEAEESFPCCSPKHGMCGNTDEFCECEGCINYNSITVTYNNIEDKIFTSTYDDNVFGTLDNNRDFIINWAMNHIPSSTWLPEIIRRAMWQTQELSSYLSSAKCRASRELAQSIPTTLAANIAQFQVAGKYAEVFGPVIDHYLANCSPKKNQVLKHKMKKIASLILKACTQVSEQCPQFQVDQSSSSIGYTKSENVEDEDSIARARPYFGLGGSFGVSRPLGYKKPPYYKKPPSRPSFGHNAGKTLIDDDGFQTLYRRLADGTYQMRRVLGN